MRRGGLLRGEAVRPDAGQQELLAVISKYGGVDLDKVSVRVEERGDGEVLELNILLPEDEQAPPGRVGARAAFA